MPAEQTVVVPRVATRDMLLAAQEAFPRSAAFVFPKIYAAMIAAAPTPAGVGADLRERVAREVTRMREVANDWRRPALAQIEGPNDLKIYGGTIADDIDRWADLLALLPPEPAGGEPVAWRPISEHDGSEGPFDLWRDGERLTDYYCRERGLKACWQKEHGYPSRTTVLMTAPSHFMPSPPPPAALQQEVL